VAAFGIRTLLLSAVLRWNARTLGGGYLVDVRTNSGRYRQRCCCWASLDFSPGLACGGIAGALGLTTLPAVAVASFVGAALPVGFIYVIP